MFFFFGFWCEYVSICRYINFSYYTAFHLFKSLEFKIIECHYDCLKYCYNFCTYCSFLIFFDSPFNKKNTKIWKHKLCSTISKAFRVVLILSWRISITRHAGGEPHESQVLLIANMHLVVKLKMVKWLDIFIPKKKVSKNVSKKANFMVPFLWMGFNCLKTRATSRKLCFDCFAHLGCGAFCVWVCNRRV